MAPKGRSRLGKFQCNIGKVGPADIQSRGRRWSYPGSCQGDGGNSMGRIPALGKGKGLKEITTSDT